MTDSVRAILAAVVLLAAAWLLDQVDDRTSERDVEQGLSQFRQTCSTEPTWAIRFNADGSSTFVATCGPARK